MRLAILIATFAMSLTQPYSASAQPLKAISDCGSPVKDSQIEGRDRPVQRKAAAGQNAPAKCAGDGALPSPHLRMLALLIVGAIVIGVPAARRRHGRVVFS
jgi:hypothetical protein